ncbi:MAG: DUF6452 family protein [Prevotellaceae bacterium]|nr:DUF6452 family protein [Prevotellaceae bacterium]
MNKESRNNNRCNKRSINMLRLLYICILSMLISACSSIDCPLENLVYTQYQLLNSSGTADTIKADTLTITTTKLEGSDSVLINKNVNTTEFSLPISYSQPQDVFYFELRDTLSNVTYDTITVSKTDKIHFESVDCTPSYFHTIDGVSYTTNAIDSIVIINSEVNYDTSKKHFSIYFKAHN